MTDNIHNEINSLFEIIISKVIIFDLKVNKIKAVKTKPVNYGNLPQRKEYNTVKLAKIE